MTQTQDEQNVQTPVTPAQEINAETPATEVVTNQPATEPVAENTVDTANDLYDGEDLDSLVDAMPDQESDIKSIELEAEQATVQNQASALIEDGTNTIASGVNTSVDTIQWVWQAWIEWIQNATSQWVEAIQWVWQAWIEWVQNVASQWVESVTTTLQQWWDTLKQTWESTVQWVMWVWEDLKEGIWNIVSGATSGNGVIESGTAVVQGTVSTATNVVWNAATSAMDTWTSVVNGTVGTVTNVATWATNVVKDSVNNIVWSVLPGQAGQWITNLSNTVTQSALDLWNKASETLQETGEKAKWFFSGLRGNLTSSLNSKEAQKVMDEANAPMDMNAQNQQAQQPAAPQVQQPVAPQVQQPAAPQVQQPAAPEAQQPVAPQVQPWDIQQPTNAA